MRKDQKDRMELKGILVITGGPGLQVPKDLKVSKDHQEV